jgi:citrate lyase beta subunit
MEEVLTIRVPKGTRKKLERRARAEHLTLSQYIRRALDTEALLGALEAARADLVPAARAQGIYTDDDVFTIVS